MTDNDKIILLNDRHHDNESDIVVACLKIAEREVSLRAKVKDCTMTVAEMVPFVRDIADKLTGYVIDRTVSNGKIVPCKKSCSACCSYLVALSVPEVVQLNKELAQDYKSFNTDVMKKCVSASSKILAAYNDYVEDAAKPFKSLSDWYNSLNLQCPFLNNNSCSIYEIRPLACREYFVIGSPESCIGVGSKPEVLGLVMSALETLGKLDAETRTQVNIDAVVLPLAFGAENNFENAEREFSTIDLVNRFFELLGAKVLQSC